MNQGITTMLDKPARVTIDVPALDAPVLSRGITKPDLITVEQATAMSLADMTTLF